MTFEQIKNEGKFYINKFGLVFSPSPNANTISLSYNIDSGSRLEILKTVSQLSALFKNPDKVDFVFLFEQKPKYNVVN